MLDPSSNTANRLLDKTIDAFMVALEREDLEAADRLFKRGERLYPFTTYARKEVDDE